MTDISFEDLAQVLPDLIADALRRWVPPSAQGALRAATGKVVTVGNGTVDIQYDDDEPGVVTTVQGNAAVGEDVTVLYLEGGRAFLPGSSGASGPGSSGALLASNNLSDLADVAVALANLGLPFPDPGPAVKCELFRKTDGSYPYSYNGLGVQAAAITQDNITEDPNTGDRYALFWNAVGQPIIVQNLASDRYWTSFNLATIAGNPLLSPVCQPGAGLDNLNHYFLSLAVGEGGYIHVSGNMHNHALQYVKSSSPRDITAWSAPGMSGLNEGTVSYPVFLALPDGTLLFIFRDGGSANGDTYVNRLEAGVWVQAGKLFDGKTDNVSMYPNKWVADADGNVHVFYVWRAPGGVDTNEGVYYAKITGLQGAGTMGAEQWDGTPIALPIRKAFAGSTGERPVTAAAGSNLGNAGGACVDQQGYPHCVVHRHDGAGNLQLDHIWRDAAGWNNELFTDFNSPLDFDDTGPWAPRPAIVCSPDDRVYVIGPWYAEGLMGSIWAWDVTPGADHRPFPIADFPDTWEITYDTRAHDRGLLRFLVLPGSKFYGDMGDNRLSTGSHLHNGQTVVPVNNFAATYVLDSPAGICAAVTIDLAQMALLAARAVKLPGIRIESQDSGGGVSDINIANVAGAASPQRLGAYITAAGPAKSPTVMIGDVYRGRPLFARLIVSQKIEGANKWIATAIQAWRRQILSTNGLRSDSTTTDSSSRICCQWVEQTDDNEDIRTTHWVSLVDFDDLNGCLGYLIANSWIASGGNATVNALSIQLGVLDGEFR